MTDTTDPPDNTRGTFSDVSDEWAQWDGSNPGWFPSGLDAVHACLVLESFTTAEVWRAWDRLGGPQPREPRRMAEVMDEAVRLGWVRRGGPVRRDLGRGGHPSFTCLYWPLLAVDAADVIEKRSGDRTARPSCSEPVEVDCRTDSAADAGTIG